MAEPGWIYVANTETAREVGTVRMDRTFEESGCKPLDELLEDDHGQG